MATQLKAQHLMPIVQTKLLEKARLITEEEKNFKAYVTLRQARVNKRLRGQREKQRRLAEEK